MVRHVPISWEQLHRDVCAVAVQLAALEPFVGIVAISRGGLVPAAILARELNCRVVETVSVLTYEEDIRGIPRVVKPAAAAGDGAGWLLVDDLVDSGATMRMVLGLLPGAYVATIYAKPLGRNLVDVCAAAISQDTWIVFPWDVAPVNGPFV